MALRLIEVKLLVLSATVSHRSDSIAYFDRFKMVLGSLFAATKSRMGAGDR